MASAHIYMLPILVFLWFPITFVVTFIIAVVLGHVNPVFPYISDSGTFSPESCVFGQLINIGALLFGLVMYIRYRQTRELYLIHNLPAAVQRLNYTSICIGLTSATGVSFVGNFQETNMFEVHIVAALVGFGFGVTYLVLQTVVSFKLYPLSGKRWIICARVVLTFICVVTFLFCGLFGVLAFVAYKGKNSEDMPKWSEADGGWEMHVVSAVNEWLTALTVMSYVLTFTPEFRLVSVSEPAVRVEPRAFDSPARPIA